MAGNIDTTNYVSVLNNAASLFTKDSKLQQTKEKKTEISKKKKTFLESFLEADTKSVDFIKDEIDYEKQLEGLNKEERKLAIENIMANLQDKVYSSGANLADTVNPQTIGEYKRAVRNCLNFVVQHALEVSSVFSGGYNMLKKEQLTKKAYITVKIVDEKMERLTKELLFNQLEKLEILERLDEIKGLIVDLIT